MGNGQSKMLGILKEMDKVFQRVLRWIIFLTPFGVLSLIVAKVGKEKDLKTMFENIGLLMGASFVACSLHFLVPPQPQPFLILLNLLPHLVLYLMSLDVLWSLSEQQLIWMEELSTL